MTLTLAPDIYGRLLVVYNRSGTDNVYTKEYIYSQLRLIYFSAET